MRIFSIDKVEESERWEDHHYSNVLRRIYHVDSDREHDKGKGRKQRGERGF